MDVLGQFLDERSLRKANTGRASEADTLAPDVMIERVLEHVNVTFYKAANAKTWLRDKPAVMLVLLWPATWLTRRGIGLPVDHYERILREILAGISEHGNLAGIKHFPTYLSHTVERWFVHQGDALYEDRKRFRNVLDLEALKQRPGGQPGPDPMEALAAAHRVLKAGKARRKPGDLDASQLPLLDL